MLSLDGPREAGELPAPLAYRLRVGLQATFGESWTLSLNEVDAAGTPALLLSLPIDMQALSPRAAGALLPPTAGVRPWMTPTTATT